MKSDKNLNQLNQEVKVFELTSLDHEYNSSKIKLRLVLLGAAAVGLYFGGNALAQSEGSTEKLAILSTEDTIPIDLESTSTTVIDTTTTAMPESVTTVVGPVVETLPDGSTVTTYPDGTVVTTYPDGNTIISTPVDTTVPPTTTASDNLTSTIPTDTTQPSTTTIVPVQQDVYGEICLPQGWTNCGEYIIYFSDGTIKNRLIADNTWGESYFREIAGMAPDDYYIKVRDYLPL